MTLMNSNKGCSIRGIGNDIIEIARIRKSIERQGQAFIERLFTPREIEYCNKYKDPIPHYAGRFAAKEAIVKALGTGFGAQIHFHDIEILNDEAGKPIAFLSQSVQKNLLNPTLFLSISHCTEYATAVAIWV